MTSKNGFTLLEVMIALVILAISLTALLSLANRTILMQAEQQNITLGTQLAESKLTEYETMRQLGHDDDNGADAGVFAKPFARYRWNVALKDTALPDVLQVTVTVLWGAKKDNDMVSLTSFVFRREGGLR
ncbi:MAG: prepilin-type N-terminal cleavage/methylation domain-containing protein [Deltaproteobacteria bacterium]|nr:prepilin-type N-terminal cleavage/methylation domain-containing protein [Deltaproteobacteria bacterium]